MNNIKYLIWSIVLLCISCQPKELPTQIVLNDNLVSVKLSHQTTKSEMDSVAEQVSKYGITMEYSNSTFFEDGKLRILALVVTTPHQSGRTNSDLIGLQTRYIGFEYDAVSSAFKIGDLSNVE